MDFAELAGRLEKIIGTRYTIERPLGRGGMATVFLAQDLRHHRAVAIKVLLPELSPVLGTDRFLREIEIAAQLNHPHIVPVHDSGEADGLLYYVMPFVEGASLRHRIAREGGLPIGDVVQIAREVADALAYAHDLGVVHRDIKPENILLTHHHATVADFGVARAIHVTWASAATSTGGLTLGTPHYMSPEQAESSPSTDHRTDIYALGCTIFEMLTGRPPFTGPGPVAVLAQHLGEPVPLPSALRADAPPEFDHVVQRAMAKVPDDRYASAAEMSADLAALGAATGARQVSIGPARRRRVGVNAALAIAALIGALGTARFLMRDHAPPVPAARALLEVVVRPFEDRGAAAGGLADQLTEDLIARLVAVPTLHVAASAAVANLRDAPLDTLRARFSPDRFVIGRLEAATGDSVRVTVQIVDPPSGRGLFDSSFVVPRDGPGLAATRLGVIVRHALWNQIYRDQRRARVSDSAAWELVERARALADAAEQATPLRLDQRVFRALDVSDSLLAEAGRRDRASDLIPVERARIAERRAFITEYFVQFMASPPRLPRPGEERRRALAILDDMIRSKGGPADAYELRGRVKQGLNRELRADSLLDGAMADFRSATERDVHRASAWKELAAAQREAGLYEEALFSVRRAFEEDAFQLYHIELLRSRFDAALRAGRMALADSSCAAWMREAPPQQRIFDCELLLWSRTRGDRHTAALARARADSLHAAGDSIGLTAALREIYVAEVLARAGLGERADATIRRLPAKLPAEWQAMIAPELAYLRLLRGDADSAAALLAGAVRAAPATRRLIETVPWFAPLRDSSRAKPKVSRP